MQAAARLIEKVKSRHDDDVIDRANYVYTATMFGMFATITMAKQYVGEPLQCWIPPEFKGWWEKYSESYCFVENTYYANIHEKLPDSKADRESRELQYYQWVGFMMIGQMIFFILPKAVWNSLNLKTGLNIQSLISTSKLTLKKGNNAVIKDNTKDDIQKASEYMKTLHRFNKDRISTQSRKPLNAKFWNGYITKLYLLFKVINLFNSIIQLYALNRFLGPKYTFWGYGLLMDLLQGKQWQESGHFPRVTYCDVDVRLPGDVVAQYTLQCVLAINMFNEKIYIFIWFWLFGLSILNFLNLCNWIFLVLSEKNAIKFVQTQLAYKNVDLDSVKTKEFMGSYLYLDAVTTLRLVQLNCGDFVSSDLISYLYKDYAPVIEETKSEPELPVEAKVPPMLQSDPEKQAPIHFH
ncbi:unnamed protein product [Bursaphelenchus okinawaensis]|uniref:Innexin n=1 Tax=Bursaphelenchus okinawaensis TaxID=465554 RepID=A0A811JSG6_9BILA|nr:unnamed protein product [Bursaphelenchus okinawaensis]CAG9080945.1 unnamed protein product [Bursaphelenchus okinawaensis]